MNATHDDLPLLIHQTLAKPPKFDFTLRCCNPRLSTLNKFTKNIQNQRQVLQIRMIPVCQFLYMLQYQTQSGKTGDRSGKEGNEVAFADGGLLRTLLDEGLVAGVAF